MNAWCATSSQRRKVGKGIQTAGRPETSKAHRRYKGSIQVSTIHNVNSGMRGYNRMHPHAPICVRIYAKDGMSAHRQHTQRSLEQV
jgi:hypothetical protein